MRWHKTAAETGLMRLHLPKKKFWIDHPIVTCMAVGLALGLAMALGAAALHGRLANPGELALGIVLLTVACGALLGYPLALTGHHLLLALWALRGTGGKKPGVGYDLWALGLAFFYEFIFLTGLNDIVFGADWHAQLANDELHTPLFTGAQPSVVTIVIVYLAGLCVLRAKPVKELPPLVAVLCISSLYLGCALVVFWTVQILDPANANHWLLLLPTLVTLAIGTKTVALAVRSFEPDPNRRGKIDRIPFLHRLNLVLMDSKRWPLAALLLALPLLALIVMILALFGQAPNSLIKAFTETSDWRLSQKVSPPNVYYDEHYLCTVAAQGHPAVVKPIRKGVRHGHEVTVNRQLMVANAFEQVLEERAPRTHRIIRGAYDRYGFPVARLITTRWAADVMWLLMKPLEWLFVVVLYMTDVHPEDRIALQYTGTRPQDIGA